MNATQRTLLARTFFGVAGICAALFLYVLVSESYVPVEREREASRVFVPGPPGIHRVLVTTDKKITGIVSALDVLKLVRDF